MSDRIPPYFFDQEPEEVEHTDVWPHCEDCGESLTFRADGSWLCDQCEKDK